MTFKEFDKKFKKIFSLSILDVDDIKWYTEEHYNELCETVFLDQNNLLDPNPYSSTGTFSKHPRHSAEIVIRPETDKKNFPLLFIMQIVPILRDSIDTKIEVLEKAVRFHMKILSVANFKKFLVKFLEVNLVYSTQTYVDKNYTGKPDERNLSSIFSCKNVESFSDPLLLSIEKIVLKSKPLLKDSGLSNEFIRSSDFKDFFYLYKVLLDSFELRKAFYERYSSKGPVVDSRRPSMSKITANIKELKEKDGERKERNTVITGRGSIAMKEEEIEGEI
eukprot:CAMPEP_0170518938 /NCGR_PEP_ID=MMETSP0209-20121228/4519_1 /TAXON_ID=665100 ORGANISM="Litonotus pictus, Strain P1" /NCGR_SAMPLE_ID=MMETSP0209 /ASSEMBLY_ACC=CAM_ASM_000301 /LENGTH=276 /DNA_ID=CAMNT_0010804691 /DNA_START=60 /DNA_END=890 /DNA_ORIENTATION=-